MNKIELLLISFATGYASYYIFTSIYYLLKDKYDLW